jgi:hypothetical protein
VGNCQNSGISQGDTRKCPEVDFLAAVHLVGREAAEHEGAGVNPGARGPCTKTRSPPCSADGAPEVAGSDVVSPPTHTACAPDVGMFVRAQDHRYRSSA